MSLFDKLFPNPQQKEIERRMALASTKRKVDELDRYCDERDRRVAAKTAQVVEFKRQNNKSRGMAVLREIDDERRCLELGLKIRRLAQKAYSRLELNRIGADAVINILPLLEQAQSETDPRRIHEAMARIDDLDKQLDSWDTVDSTETVEKSAELEDAWDRIGSDSVAEDEPVKSAPAAPRPVAREAKAEPDPKLASLQDRLKSARERMDS
jgi:hypothetical protein